MAPITSFDPQGLPYDQPTRPLLRTLSIWLVAAGMAVFFVTLYLYSAGIRSDIASLQAEIKPLLATQTSVRTPEPQVLQLMSTLAPLEASIKEIQAIKPTIAAGRIDWPSVIAVIGDYDTNRLFLLSVTQNGNEITLKGRAVDDTAMAAYTHMLESSGLFQRLVVQSVRAVSTPFAPASNTPSPQPAATSTPTPRASPTTASTPTPDPRDPFEPDDTQPGDVFLGQPQVHNFFPVGDVDRVRFLAKAGRHYRVFTSDLAAGVDTVLVVQVGGTTYTNDDSRPGVLASMVSFQAPGADTQAIVEIRNRGSYGPGRSYRITVEEFIPTPAPPSSATRTTTPTATPAQAVPVAMSDTKKPAGLASLGFRVAQQTADSRTVEFVIVLTVRGGAP